MVLERLRRFLSGSESVSVGIRPIPGGEVALALHEFEQDPAWRDPRGLVMVAPLDPDTNPLCLAVDGDRHPPGTTKESLSLDHLRCGNCDCYLLPLQWTTDLMRDPQGRFHPVKRPAVGDNGEAAVPFSLTAERWLRANPQTAHAMLGEEIAAAFLGRAPNGLPLPPISLKDAARRWSAPILEKASLEMALAEESRVLRRNHREQRQREKNAKRQVIALEKEKRFSEARAICLEALEGDWAGDWAHRLARLERRSAALASLSDRHPPSTPLDKSYDASQHQSYDLSPETSGDRYGKTDGTGES